MSTPPLMPSTIDLIDLNSVKSWLGIALDNHDEDSKVQDLITGFSQYVLNQCGVESFNSVQHYIEIYDGNGAVRIFPDNRPVVTVNSIQAGGYIIPASSGLTSAGWYIERGGKSIAIRCGVITSSPGRANYFPYIFPQGTGNIQIDYTAGYERVPFDLAEMAMKVVAINYSRKDWRDLASKSLSAQGGSGSTIYRAWAMPPECNDVLDVYSRYARS